MSENVPSRTVTDLMTRDERVVAGAEKLRFFPLAVAGGRGSTIEEVGGRKLIDFSATWTASGLGHGNSQLARAVADAIATGQSSSILSSTHRAAVEVAELLLELIPAPKSQENEERRVYLGHAGTDANDVALRGCRHATGRRQIIAFTDGYHGGMGLAQGVSGVHVQDGAVPAAPNSELLPYVSAHADAETLESVLADVRTRMEGGDVAAVIVEAIQSDGGIIVPHQGFLPGLRKLCDEYGVYLVMDEVKAGLGRTGRIFAFEESNVVPDVVTLGKALGAGIPISAAVGPAAVLDEPAASALMTTIGNAVGCAAALVMLGELRKEWTLENVARSSARLVEQLATYANSDRPGASLIAEIRGRGLMYGLQFTVPQSARGQFSSALNVASKVAFRAWQIGLVIYPVGEGALELTPSLTISFEEIDTGIKRLLRAIDDVANGAVTDEDIAPYLGW